MLNILKKKTKITTCKRRENTWGVRLKTFEYIVVVITIKKGYPTEINTIQQRSGRAATLVKYDNKRIPQGTQHLLWYLTLKVKKDTF